LKEGEVDQIGLRLAVACVLAGSPALAAFDADPVKEWIGANAIRLTTAEARHGFSDMRALKKVVGNARIVSLGEATHGTREFFQLKHRMMEFLATEMGFTIFSIEANMPEAYRLNDYVLKGEGDPAKLLKGMYFWTWDTQEVLDMILWMREFNQSGKGRVEFTGFDMQTPTVAAQIVRDFAAKYDSNFVPALTEASRVATRSPSGTFGGATASFPVKDASGKLRISGYVRTEGVTEGLAAIWARADGESGMLAFDSLQNRGLVKGTTDWKRYTIEIPVASGATKIVWGVLLSGRGTAWFDALEIELDGKPYTSGAWDLDFESPSPKGFSTYGNGYQVRLDTESFRSGKQSLQIRNIQPVQPEQPAVDPKTAVSLWKDVLKHMESSREAYRTKAGAREAEWAIQNARVVLQCMQSRANEVTRDRSMAENVKWILDQNPAAKIVLWAHNGHVATSGYSGYQPMGASLREMYGDRMVVFGFGFNQGSFQAMKQGAGLRDITVPPAPAGSLDATLAASGIPIFALDLRRAPPSGPVAEWLDAPHKARSIGAVYTEDSSTGYMSDLRARQCFDVLLFVEKTTAARKNAATATQEVAFQIRPAAGAASAKEYRDPDYGVSFTLPSGWEAKRSSRWGDRETTVWLGDPTNAALYYRVLAPDKELPAEEISRDLAAGVDQKVGQRRDAGLADYTIRRELCRERTVGGRQALSCTGEFTQNGQAMAEYLTWVRSAKTLGLFFARVPAAELASFRERFDRIIETLRIP
jgi:erythromycin esterase-like protein